MNLFVTGTDTEVGKTYFTALLVRALRAAGVDAVGYKPIACGDWGDVDALLAVCGDDESRDTLCGQHFKMPASPLTAAFAEQREVDLQAVMAGYQNLVSRHQMVVVEGIGGWRVPITPHYSVSDLARELNLPVIVIVRNKLGALNHTQLTVEAIEQCGLSCAGLVLNHFDAADEPAAHSNRATFELMKTAPIICELTRDQSELNPDIVAAMAGIR